MPKGLLLKELCRYKIGTYADVIYRNALLTPDGLALVYGDERITFQEYNARVNRLIHALNRLGLKKGDVVGLLTWNCLEALDVYGATLKGGFIASPFNPRLNVEELAHIIEYSQASVLFVGPELAETAEKLQPRLSQIKSVIRLEGGAPPFPSCQDIVTSESADEPDFCPDEDDPVAIIYTSGTTGLPRGALYTNRRFMEDTRNLIQDLHLGTGEKHLQITPLFHIAANAFYRTFMTMGGSNVILKTFDPSTILQTIERERITHMIFVPTQLVALLNAPDREKYDTSSMKFMWYGGSPMPIEVLKQGLQAFGSVFGQGYGQSESGPGISHLSRREHDVLDGPEVERKRLLSVGRPDVGVQARIVDDQSRDLATGEVGEIIIRSRQMMSGYWRMPEETRATIVDGWLHTGDLGYFDEGGYIFLVDRKKDMIISGGENVYPREVEEVLYKHPGVAEAAVIGVPDQYWVEKVLAVVVPSEDARPAARELIDFCRENMAAYKAPKSVEFVESLPKNAAGKILKRELKGPIPRFGRGLTRTDTLGDQL